MTVADATPDLEHLDKSDRAFLGHLINDRMVAAHAAKPVTA